MTRAGAGPVPEHGTVRVRSYSHFVVGLDQVWNPAYTNVNPEWFLSSDNLLPVRDGLQHGHSPEWATHCVSDNDYAQVTACLV